MGRTQDSGQCPRLSHSDYRTRASPSPRERITLATTYLSLQGVTSGLELEAGAGGGGDSDGVVWFQF